jgi:hypothetical protein
MPADLERQLARLAEALDRKASAISVDEILSRATVAVDVSRLERSSSDQVPRVAAASWGDPAARHDGDGERHTSIELAPTSAEPPTRRRVALKIALAAAAATVLVVALTAIVRVGDDPGPAVVPPSTVPAPPPSIAPAPPPTTQATTAPTSGGMWPQSTLEEVRVAQERADAGDPDYTWQVGADLVEGDPNDQVELELIERFIREVLGWEAYLFHEGGNFSDLEGALMNGWVEGTVTGQRYLRCAPDRTNPLYPPPPDSGQPDASCAPTIDDLRYESVRVDIAQLDRQGRGGVWVVSGWELTEPFVQADPAVVEAEGRERLEEFLAARVAGDGAERYVQVVNDRVVPLLYATTAGAPYERYEIERLDVVRWPDARMTFSVRLFTSGDATVVEQQFGWARNGTLLLENRATTEDGQPIVVFSTSSDGEVSVSAPDTWATWLPGKGAGEGGHEQALDVWFGGLWRRGEFFGSGERIELVDPVAYDAWCAANGGSPLLSAPARANAIAQQLIADPNFETTAPVAARVGGVDAVSIDVALAPGGTACGIEMIEISRWIHGLSKPGWRVRLYLVDLPQGMSVETLAITVVAPEDRFDDVIAETAPIIESIEFHPA